MTSPAEPDATPVRFTEGAIAGVSITPLTRHSDDRGWLVELFRRDELASDVLPAMAYLSETLPGVTRGPHEHVAQTDCFAFLGPGTFRLYLWDMRHTSSTQGRRQTLDVGEHNPTRVIVPPGVVHAYRNVGDVPGWVLNAPNQLFAGHGRCQPVDEIRHENNPNSPFHLD
ncbi:MAG: dTDP-4-dehydrorhamnose 3,5-epimerase family protein [Planctomycetales bacterium]|nr:dTDP-4-dehydrorhamnose 3,5-epimerase family protein [Planctomycetales bacterium]